MSEEQNVSAPEVVNSAPEVSTPAASESPIVNTEASVTGDNSKLASDDKPDFTPNYKFKVMDEEKEIDEWLRPVIKDADTEKKAREILEKAYGLDYAKPKHEERELQLKEISEQYHNILTPVQEVLSARDAGDFDTMLELINVPVEKMAQWLVDKANRLNLPEDQQKVYNEFDTTRRTNMSLERRLQAMEQREQTQSVQARTSELNQVLQRPEVTQAIKQFEARPGLKPGAFRDAVIKQAKAEWFINKQDISAEQAVQQVMALANLQMQQSGQVAPAAIIDTAQLPVIPRISGKSVSPTSKQPRSVEDLKKLAKGNSL